MRGGPIGFVGLRLSQLSARATPAPICGCFSAYWVRHSAPCTLATLNLCHTSVSKIPPLLVSLPLSLSLYCSFSLAIFSLYFGKFHFLIVMVLAIIISCIFGFSSHFLAPRVMIQLGVHFLENPHLLNVFTV